MRQIFICLFVSFLANCDGVSGAVFQHKEDIQKVEYQYEVEKWLNSVDYDLSQFNSLAAHITWQLSTAPDEKSALRARDLGQARNKWKNDVCQSEIRTDWITKEQQRKWYLLCRGPKFTDDSVLDYLRILGEMAQEYNSQICLKNSFFTNITNENFPKPGDCLYGEPDLERLMKRNDLSGDQLKWIWVNWHDSVGPRIRDLFKIAVDFQNLASKNNGYNDIGETWREELEIPDLETFVFQIYDEIKPLYILLHAVVRHKLFQKYGASIIDFKGPIPVHLLGNMWGQDWGSLIDLFDLNPKKIDLNEKLARKNLKMKDLALEAEDFYTSMSLPKMTQKFWKWSIFEDSGNATLCHGSAANLYSKDDFRMLMCGKSNMEDFYVIHHEMGHVEYYMAYSEQPMIFQDGTNTAVHESIGDAIMHGVMTPQHLHRLSLLSDEQLLDNSTEFYLLFQQALSKIPELPFSLLIDKYRWEIFRGDIPYDQWNERYWEWNLKLRGIAPPDSSRARNERFFDAGAKFHIPDNTPYIRYFLSSVLQMQIFKSMCELSLYGRISENPRDQHQYLPLNRCDVYGSKRAGKNLLKMMERGASIHWTEALRIMTGVDFISTEPFLQYYKPVYEWLENYVEKYEIPVGW